jgi:hypothetical protein
MAQIQGVGDTRAVLAAYYGQEDTTGQDALTILTLDAFAHTLVAHSIPAPIETPFAISPDGQRIAWMTVGGRIGSDSTKAEVFPRRTLCITDIDGHVLTDIVQLDLPDPSEILVMGWSPDQSRIVLITHGRDVYVVPSN